MNDDASGRERAGKRMRAGERTETNEGMDGSTRVKANSTIGDTRRRHLRGRAPTTRTHPYCRHQCEVICFLADRFEGPSWLLHTTLGSKERPERVLRRLHPSPVPYMDV